MDFSGCIYTFMHTDTYIRNNNNQRKETINMRVREELDEYLMRNRRKWGNNINIF